MQILYLTCNSKILIMEKYSNYKIYEKLRNDASTQRILKNLVLNTELKNKSITGMETEATLDCCGNSSHTSDITTEEEVNDLEPTTSNQMYGFKLHDVQPHRKHPLVESYHTKQMVCLSQVQAMLR